MATKEKLLIHLKEKKGQWVSGESLTEELAVSRAAICKHVKRLRKEGYGIASSTRKGYLFTSPTDRLLAREIRQDLGTHAFGKGQIHYFDEIDSTNLKAKSLAGSGAPEGTIVISERQTKGRGRKTRGWFSPPRDGIYLSLILRPNIAPRSAPSMTLLTAVAIAETLLAVPGLEIAIKWPNDILARGKKLAGILTEMSTTGERIDYAVVGLGLNVNTSRFPDEIEDRATSILIETGQRVRRVTLAKEYLKWHEEYYGVFQRIGFEPIRKRWKELTNIMGQQVTVETIDTEYTGEVQDIDDGGALILRDETGGYRRVIFGDVTLR